MTPNATPAAERFLFVADAHAIVCGREVRPGDVVAVVPTEGRAVISIELPFHPAAVLDACELGTLRPHEDADARLAALTRPVTQRDPRVIPFPMARRFPAECAQ